MAQVAVRNRSKALDALFHPATLFIFLMLVAVRAFAGSATLAWDPVSSPALTGYVVHYGATAGNYTSQIDVGNITTRTVSNLTEGATYHFAVTAYDSSHTESGFSNDTSTTIPFGAPVASFAVSTTSGVAPLALNFTNTSTGSISTYAWTFGDGTSSTAQHPSHVYSAAGVYTVSLTVTGSGGSSTKSMPNYVTVTAATTSDTSPPTAPSTLAASASGGSSINLSWKASTDNVGVTGYRIERCQGTGCTTFAQIATSTGTAFSNTGLAAGTSYSYRVSATDAAGNLSAYSNPAIATTTAVAAAPVAAFSANPTSGTAPLTVNFSSSSTGTISSYAWSFGDGTTSTAQNPSRVYSAAGTYTVSLTVTGSGGSSTKSMPNYVTVTVATTSDTSPPTATSTLAASASGSSIINLTWKASTDNVGVTGYRIERCQSAGCTAFAQIATSTGTAFSNTGLAAGTSYRYRLRATDAAGDISAYSNTATATTALTAVSIVDRYYQAILGRAPDASGKAFWDSEIARMQALGVDVKEAYRAMATYFFSSVEYASFAASDTRYVTDLYETFFNRAPEATGLAYWTTQLASGLPRNIVLYSFLFSPEFTTYMSGLLGNTASRAEVYAVVDFYRGILNRLPDTAGFSYWLGKLQAAQCSGRNAADAVYATIDAVSSQFIASAEYAGRQRNNTEYVSDLYYAFLRRGGDLSGVDYWVNRLDTGVEDREMMRRDFINSPEFSARISAIIQQGC